MQFTPEHDQIRRTVAKFVAQEINPHVDAWEAAEEFPSHEVLGKLGALGLLGIKYDPAYGGLGLDFSYSMVMAEELGLIECGGVPMAIGVHTDMCTPALNRFGSDELKRNFLAPSIAGEVVGCLGVSEPGGGSDVAAVKTTARRDGDDLVISGTKMWITNGNLADVATVWAQTDEGIRGFVVPTDTPGFSANVIHKKLSLRASVTSELVLDNVRLPASAQLPEAVGLRGPLSCLNEARFGIVFGALGAARDSLEAAIDYAGAREVFDRPLSSYQLTQEKLADMTLELGKGMLLALQLGRLKDTSGVTPDQISLGKLNNVREALAIARESRTIMGASGITLEYSPLRHANNLESVLTYEGTSEMHMLSIGRALTGQSAFR